MSTIRFTEEQGEALLKRLATMPKGRLLNQDDQTKVLQAAKAVKLRNKVTTHRCEGPAEIERESDKSRQRSNLEVMLQEQIEQAGLPTPEYDVCYLIGSKHRLDVCWRDKRFGVEVQGQLHRIKGRFKADITKRALSLLQDWRVLEVDRETIKSGKAIEWIRRLLNR